MKAALKHYDLYLMLVPALVWVVIYKFVPLFGLSIAFKEYDLFSGDGMFDSIINSPWVGLAHFEQLFARTEFTQALTNTVVISLYKLVFLFPVPIVLALLLNEIRSVVFKRSIQTLIYLPHFLSWIVVFGIFYTLLGNDGLVNHWLRQSGGETVSFFMDKTVFRSLLVVSDGWKEAGWGTIVYLAAIASIDTEQYEAAEIDGAGRFVNMVYITLPGMLPVIILMFMMKLGHILEAGFGQILVMYNPTVYEVADIIQTYIYRIGLGQMNFSQGAALGLFESVLGFIFIVSGNWLCKRLVQRSIW